MKEQARQAIAKSCPSANTACLASNTALNFVHRHRARPHRHADEPPAAGMTAKWQRPATCQRSLREACCGCAWPHAIIHTCPVCPACTTATGSACRAVKSPSTAGTMLGQPRRRLKPVLAQLAKLRHGCEGLPHRCAAAGYCGPRRRAALPACRSHRDRRDHREPLGASSMEPLASAPNTEGEPWASSWWETATTPTTAITTSMPGRRTTIYSLYHRGGRKRPQPQPQLLRHPVMPVGCNHLKCSPLAL